MSIELSEAEIKSAALFFLFAQLNEVKAVESTGRALQTLQILFERNNKFRNSTTIIRECSALIKKKSSTFNNFQNLKYYKFPSDIKIKPWLKCYQESDLANLITFIWVAIVGISSKEVAIGLNLTENTVNYRVGQMYQLLGRISEDENA